METIKDRLTKFYKTIGITKREFERRCGFSNGYMDKLKDCPSSIKLERILSEFPQLDRVWLVTGEGDMLNESQTVSGEISGNVINGHVGGDVNSNAAIVKALEINQKSQEQIDRLLAIIERLT